MGGASSGELSSYYAGRRIARVRVVGKFCIAIGTRPIGEADPVRSHLVALWRAERTSIPHRVRGVEKVAGIVPPVPGDEMQQCDRGRSRRM